jgi:hypothetical protein
MRRFATQGDAKAPRQQPPDSSVFSDDYPSDVNSIEEHENGNPIPEEPKLLWYMHDHSQRPTDPSAMHGINRPGSSVKSRYPLVGPSTTDFSAMPQQQAPEPVFDNKVGGYPMTPPDYDIRHSFPMDETSNEIFHSIMYDAPELPEFIQPPLPTSPLHNYDQSSCDSQEALYQEALYQTMLYQSGPHRSELMHSVEHHRPGSNIMLGYMDQSPPVEPHEEFESAAWWHR